MLANRCLNTNQERHILERNKTDFSIINILSNKSASNDKLNECEKTNNFRISMEVIPRQKPSKEEWSLELPTFPLMRLARDTLHPFNCDNSDIRKLYGLDSMMGNYQRSPNSTKAWASSLKQLSLLPLEYVENPELKRDSISVPSSPEVLHRPVPIRPLSGGHFTCSTTCGHGRTGDVARNSVSSYSRHKLKRLRTAFSTSQMSILEKTFKTRHYVIGERRKELANLLGLSETQVKVWFQNRRTKYKKLTQDSTPND